MKSDTNKDINKISNNTINTDSLIETQIFKNEENELHKFENKLINLEKPEFNENNSIEKKTFQKDFDDSFVNGNLQGIKNKIIKRRKKEDSIKSTFFSKKDKKKLNFVKLLNHFEKNIPSLNHNSIHSVNESEIMLSNKDIIERKNPMQINHIIKGGNMKTIKNGYIDGFKDDYNKLFKEKNIERFKNDNNERFKDKHSNTFQYDNKEKSQDGIKVENKVGCPEMNKEILKNYKHSEQFLNHNCDFKNHNFTLQDQVKNKFALPEMNKEILKNYKNPKQFLNHNSDLKNHNFTQQDQKIKEEKEYNNPKVESSKVRKFFGLLSTDDVKKYGNIYEKGFLKRKRKKRFQLKYFKNLSQMLADLFTDTSSIQIDSFLTIENNLKEVLYVLLSKKYQKNFIEENFFTQETKGFEEKLLWLLNYIKTTNHKSSKRKEEEYKFIFKTTIKKMKTKFFQIKGLEINRKNDMEFYHYYYNQNDYKDLLERIFKSNKNLKNGKEIINKKIINLYLESDLFRREFLNYMKIHFRELYIKKIFRKWEIFFKNYETKFNNLELCCKNIISDLDKTIRFKFPWIHFEIDSAIEDFSKILTKKSLKI